MVLGNPIIHGYEDAHKIFRQHCLRIELYKVAKAYHIKLNYALYVKSS